MENCVNRLLVEVLTNAIFVFTASSFPPNCRDEALSSLSAAKAALAAAREEVEGNHLISVDKICVLWLR
jgi:hypothetical protein